jgi:enterochelin esterase family protein
MNVRPRLFAIAGALLAWGSLGLSPAFAATNTPPTRSGPVPVISPEVHPDCTVTFRLHAPKAGEVTVSGEWPGGPKAMTKNDQGVWSVTLGPLEPDLYGYGFSVDGFRTLDPANPSVKPMRSPTTSILDVPAAQPLLHDFQPNVPHGIVRQHAYQSKSLGKRRNLCVYTPPDYDKQTHARYPVLYLFHGMGDNEGTWTALGRAHFIADNLIAQGKARPMIIVMTDGHAAPLSPDGSGDIFANNMQAFERDLLEDVLPFIEASYRTRADRADRAIIGLSMGGGQSLTVGLKHLDLFAWVGGMSSAVRNPDQTIAGALAAPKATNRRLRLLWFACGKDDFLLKENQSFDELLKARGIRHEFELTAGNHSWPVWRRYLADFLPRLFVQKPRHS